MKIKNLSLKNIRSYKDEEISFPEGSMLLSGDIGSGKTSILLAVEYALFGLQPGQRGSSLLRNGANSGFVELCLEIEGKKVIISRKLKRSHKSVTNEYASITIENERHEASLTEIKTKILQLLGYPHEFIKKNNLLYRYTVYTPQEEMKQIINEDPETRLNILRYILGIDKYKRVRENMVILLNNIKEEAKAMQFEIKDLDEERSRLNLKRAQLKLIEEEMLKKSKTLELKLEDSRKVSLEIEELEKRIKEKEYLEKEVEKTKIMISTKYENKATIESEIFELKKTIEESKESFSEQEYDSILAQINEKSELIEALNASYTNFLSEISALERQQQETLVKRERIFKIEICPTCLQDVPDVHKHNILNETENIFSKIKQKLSVLDEEILKITRSIKIAKTEKKFLEEKKALKEVLRTRLEYFEKARKRHIQIKLSMESLEKDIALLEKHASSLKEKIFGFSKFDSLIRHKKNELSSALLDERKAEIELAEIKKELAMTTQEIFEKEEYIASKEKLKKILISNQELQDWLSINFLELIEFIERNVLMRLRQEFSRIFSKWFNMLVPQNTSLYVRLDESFSPIIIYKDIEMEYTFLSGGERTAVALAYRLALNQIINSIFSKIKTKDLVILDEPTDGFSEAQLYRIREVLNELKVAQLIIVSHEQKVESFVDNIIKIKKHGDISYLEPPNSEKAIVPNLESPISEKLKYTIN